MRYGSHPVAVHVYLTALNSSTTSLASKRRLLAHLNPDIIALADDKYGSRLADVIWLRSDGYSRQKLMRDVIIPHERELISSHYGRFFASQRCNTAQWKKDSKKWNLWDEQQRRSTLSDASLYPHLGAQDDDADHRAHVSVEAADLQESSQKCPSLAKPSDAQRITHKQRELAAILSNV